MHLSKEHAVTDLTETQKIIIIIIIYIDLMCELHSNIDLAPGMRQRIFGLHLGYILSELRFLNPKSTRCKLIAISN